MEEWDKGRKDQPIQNLNSSERTSNFEAPCPTCGSHGRIILVLAALGSFFPPALLCMITEV